MNVTKNTDLLVQAAQLCEQSLQTLDKGVAARKQKSMNETNIDPIVDAFRTALRPVYVYLIKYSSAFSATDVMCVFLTEEAAVEHIKTVWTLRTDVKEDRDTAGNRTFTSVTVINKNLGLMNMEILTVVPMELYK